MVALARGNRQAKFDNVFKLRRTEGKKGYMRGHVTVLYGIPAYLMLAASLAHTASPISGRPSGARKERKNTSFFTPVAMYMK
jgi:hypothetical protein